MTYKWIVQVKGKRLSESWEISVIRTDYEHGQRSWGWFDDRKILVSHNGGPCQWPIPGFIWDRNIEAAESMCMALNSGFSLNDIEFCGEENDGFPK